MLQHDASRATGRRFVTSSGPARDCRGTEAAMNTMQCPASERGMVVYWRDRPRMLRCCMHASLCFRGPAPIRATMITSVGEGRASHIQKITNAASKQFRLSRAMHVCSAVDCHPCAHLSVSRTLSEQQEQLQLQHACLYTSSVATWPHSHNSGAQQPAPRIAQTLEVEGGQALIPRFVSMWDDIP
jgi:hypothetical protein